MFPTATRAMSALTESPRLISLILFKGLLTSGVSTKVENTLAKVNTDA